MKKKINVGSEENYFFFQIENFVKKDMKKDFTYENNLNYNIYIFTQGISLFMVKAVRKGRLYI